MGEIVNLNRARKSRAKADRKAEAAANRVAHGRTKAEKQAASLDQARAARLLDGKKRETPRDD
ncbi:hypothetical protein SH203_00090 [Brevundimonas sp. SH203]|uniref:DUF4169 family protein n=1 Tax=Brevundimonas sp. SH203 TaxID=345167 RepID=UPI0009C52586|nr:DUF4169 family protein [Brevundimonas sp. SH203]GAW39714.1 hypothetical protein SH203_00090 [Brevundimonas sp. SH203]